MKVILHIGAHRTGTTSFQAYVRKHATPLLEQGIGFWGPVRTRKGLFTGIQPVPGLGLSAARRARGRILLQIDKAARMGVETLVISDENMMGTPRQNLRTHTLYPDVGVRLSRYVCAFDGLIDKVVMSVRSLDHYWASTVAFGVMRGHAVPGSAHLEQIASSPRTWRDVVSDVACAAPSARIQVIPFESNIGRADLTLAKCLGRPVPWAKHADWLNRRPEPADLRAVLVDRGADPDQISTTSTPWTPFNEQARAVLREAYADDMHWLVAGADGLATLTEEMDQTRAGQTPPRGPTTRGQEHDSQERRLAQPR